MTIDRTRARVKADKEGQVVFDVLEEFAPLNSTETEIILALIEQAVNDAATEFTETLNELQDKVSATLVHDLRSPMTAARANAELLARRPDCTPFVKKTATRISNSMDRLGSMIRDLLDASTLQADHATNIAEDVIFSTTGRDVRHTPRDQMGTKTP